MIEREVLYVFFGRISKGFQLRIFAVRDVVDLAILDIDRGCLACIRVLAKSDFVVWIVQTSHGGP